MDELPAIDRIPGVTVLGDVVAHRTRPWGGEPVPVPLAVSVVLWLVLAADVTVGGWLVAVWYAAVPCSGWPCTVATWGHPGFLLAVSAVSAVLLVSVAAVSRGLIGVTPVELGVVLVGAAAGIVAVAGVLALLLGVAAVLGLAGGLLLMVIERI